MKIPIYQIDAFTSKVFSGNPAAVCPLDEWLEDSILQSIALENNLSETAFFIPESEGYHLRWFTPVAEVDLCGHATLATAYVIFNDINTRIEKVSFQTRSGLLIVTSKANLLQLDFPAQPPEPCEADQKLLQALGGNPLHVLRNDDYFVTYETEAEIRNLKPNMQLLNTVDSRGVIVTAKGDQADFVSRFFAPKFGVPEDPVTGSAHCALIPYWSDKLGKTKLHAYQLSARGGELFCEHNGDRVIIAGCCVKYMEGFITI